MRINTDFNNSIRISAAKTIFAIVINLLYFLFLIFFSFFLFLASLYLSYYFIKSNQINLILISLCLGLIGIGSLIFFFVINLFFSKYTFGNNQEKRIEEDDQPHLWALIAEVANLIECKRPKHLYLTHDYNAFVTNDSIIQSILMPKSKDLYIGIGLLSVLTKSELKAIIAHELAHTSQKSTSLSYYIYMINLTINRSLEEDKISEKIKNKFNEISDFAFIFIFIANLIKTVILRIYMFLTYIGNTNYYNLSRYLEFEADSFSAKIAGSKSCETSMIKSIIGNFTFEQTINFYLMAAKSKQISQNIYLDQFFISSLIAKKYNVPVVLDLPQFTLEILNKIYNSQIDTTDLLASHPSNTERVLRIRSLNQPDKSEIDFPAKNLVINLTELQEEFTSKIFDGELDPDTRTLSNEEFINEYLNSLNQNNYSSIYNNYYDLKDPIKFEMYEINNIALESGFESLFNKEKIELVNKEVELTNDIQQLKYYLSNKANFSTFLYKMKPLEIKEVLPICDKLELELKEVTSRLKFNDIQIFIFFQSKESEKSNTKKLEELYVNYFNFKNDYFYLYNIIHDFYEALNFITKPQKAEDIDRFFQGIVNMEETIKAQMQHVLDNPNIFCTQESYLEEIQVFLESDLIYFYKDKYIDDNIAALQSAIEKLLNINMLTLSDLKRNLLEYQAELLY